jgi:hypothetical protein
MLAAALLGIDAISLAADRTRVGQLLATFVFQELRRQATARDEPMTFCHFRDKDARRRRAVRQRDERRIRRRTARGSSARTLEAVLTQEAGWTGCCHG